MRYKYKFMTEAQALLHGDLHSGSIMVTDTDTKVIDPEFGFMGPMAFDIGNYIGNLLLAYFSRPGGMRMSNVALTIRNGCFSRLSKLWSVFTREFRQLWDNKTQGDAWSTEMYQQNRAALEDAQDQFLPRCLKIPGECRHGNESPDHWFCWRCRAETD